MLLWISSNSCSLILLLVRSHQAEIIIVKRLIQGRNNVTRVRAEPKSYKQNCRKNDPSPSRPHCRQIAAESLYELSFRKTIFALKNKSQLFHAFAFKRK